MRGEFFYQKKPTQIVGLLGIAGVDAAFTDCSYIKKPPAGAEGSRGSESLLLSDWAVSMSMSLDGDTEFSQAFGVVVVVEKVRALAREHLDDVYGIKEHFRGVREAFSLRFAFRFHFGVRANGKDGFQAL